MKKMLCTIAMCVALVSGAFAQEAEASASKKGGFDYHNIKIEAAVPLVFPGIGFDVRGSYQFDINENWWWNAGLDCEFMGYITGKSFDLPGFASIGWKTIYLSYGLGVGFCDAQAAFIPVDLRFGWQPGFLKKDSGLSFKIEAGLFGIAAPESRAFGGTAEENAAATPAPRFMAAPGVNIGAAYKF